MSEVWYKDGLRFQCTRCGNCCTGAPGVVWVNQMELRAIAEFRKESDEQVVGLYTHLVDGQRSLREKANGDCVFYERGQGCTIYPVRPRQCRTWPFWDSTTLTPEHWKRTQQTCPGAGQGELIPSEEITRRVRVIRL